MNVHPLIFQPIFKPRIWGGRKLESLLGKNLPSNELIGESWEVVDLEGDQSVVAVGPAAGRTLHELAQAWASDLVGRAELIDGRFPLLLKFLDAHEMLSVQVHPDEHAARRIGGDARSKDEAWYIVDAEPGAVLFRGVRQGVDADGLKTAVEQKRVESVLHKIAARRGNAYYLPGGTIHALGSGLVVAEVQTPSDTTYRVYDWDRVDPATGGPRDLHVKEAMECASLDPIPLASEKRQHVGSVWTAVTSLVRSKSFVVERVRMVEGVEQPIPHAEMVIWMVLEGSGSIAYDGPGSPLPFGLGDTVVIPAALKQGHVQAHANCLWLEVTIPIPSALTGFERPDRGQLADRGSSGQHFVPLNIPGKTPGP